MAEVIKSSGIAPRRHGYAKQKIFELGNKIQVAGEGILLPRNKFEYNIYEVKKLDTHLKSTSQLMEEGEIKEITNYNDLIEMGFMIVSMRKGAQFFHRQIVTYSLKKYNEFLEHRKTFPDEHHIEYDTLNHRIRLVGKNAGPLGAGQWVFLTRRPQQNQNISVNIIDDHQKIKRQLLSKYIDIEDMPEIIRIKEIPVMISNRGELVCLENIDDQPVIGIVGARGTGKSTMAHAIIDHAYHKISGMRIAVINDSLNQTLPWSTPCDMVDYGSDKFGTTRVENIFTKGARKIGEHPMPLAIVWLHPNTNTLRGVVHPEEDISFRITVPFEHVIRNYSYFFWRKKEWQLGKSAPYFRNLVDELIKCSNLDEIEEVLNVAVEEEKLNKQSKDKIYSVLIDIFNQRILDVNTHIPSLWTVIRKDKAPRKLNPVLACMEAGVIPIVMTQNLLSKDYFPQYMRYFIDSIFEYQIDEVKFRDEPTWLYIDELPDVSATTNKTVAAESLKRCVTEGRSPKLGTMYALQNWSKVDPLIRNNTTHLFCYQNKSKEAREIAKDFGLKDYIEKSIIKLQKFRLIGMTHEKFVVYTSDGRRYTTSEPIQGMSVMPLSQHMAPGSGKKGGDDDDDEKD